MRTVTYGGDRHLLLERAGKACLLYHPGTGDRFTVPLWALDAVPEEPTLVTAGRGVEPGADLQAAAPGRRAVGLVAELDRRGPTPVRELLDYDLCESDLHGLLAELTAAGLLAETSVGGERGYRVTDVAARQL